MTKLPLRAGLPDDGDQVARQRRKRAAALLDRSVAGFDELTLDDVVRSVIAAADEAKGALDVEEFLTNRGHGWQTIELVRTCLTLVDRYEPSPSHPTP